MRMQPDAHLNGMRQCSGASLQNLSWFRNNALSLEFDLHAELELTRRTRSSSV